MPISTDVVIIGAGPSGLFQVFELGLLDILLPQLAKSWDNPEGEMVRHLLKTRDQCMQSDESIFPSRVTGISVMILSKKRSALHVMQC